MPEKESRTVTSTEAVTSPTLPSPLAVGVLWRIQGCVAVPMSLHTPTVELLGPGAEERHVVPLSLPCPLASNFYYLFFKRGREPLTKEI